MNAVTSIKKIFGKLMATKSRICLLLVVAMIGFGLAQEPEPVFNDANYANLKNDLDKTIELPDGSPEQAVAYMKLGKHLDKPIYGAWNGMDVVHWVRDPRNPLRPLIRRHPLLTKDWDTKDEDGLSNADHYRGFKAGPVSGAQILFQESAAGNLDKLNVLLRQHAGTDPDSLDLAAQEALLDKALVYDAEGREMLRDLTSRRLLGEQARGYRKLTEAAGIAGLALRRTQRNCLWFLGGLFLFRRFLRALREERRLATAPAAARAQATRTRPRFTIAAGHRPVTATIATWSSRRDLRRAAPATLLARGHGDGNRSCPAPRTTARHTLMGRSQICRA